MHFPSYTEELSVFGILVQYVGHSAPPIPFLCFLFSLMCPRTAHMLGKYCTSEV